MARWRRATITRSYGKDIGTDTVSEDTWQAEVRKYDLEEIGILGYTFDMIASVASTTRLFIEYKGKEVDNPAIQNVLHRMKWRYHDNLSEAIYGQIRLLASVGEFEVAMVDNTLAYFSVSQRIKSTSDLYQRYSLTDDNKAYADIPKQNILRCFTPRPGRTLEAYSPARRVLPLLNIYSEVLNSIGKTAKSAQSIPTIVWLGRDDESWRSDDEYVASFGDNNPAVPKILNDFSGLARKMMKNEIYAPFFPMVGEDKPEVMHINSPIDTGTISILEDLDKRIATGLNIPAQLITAESTNHWNAWMHDQQLKRQTIEPNMNRITALWTLILHEHYGLDRKYNVGFAFDSVDQSSEDKKIAIEAYRQKIVSSEYVRKVIGASPDDTPSDEDLNSPVADNGLGDVSGGRPQL